MNKNLLIVSIALIAIGIFAMNYDRIAYSSEREEVGWGPFTTVQERPRTVSMSKVLGIIAIIVGGILLYTKVRKR